MFPLVAIALSIASVCVASVRCVNLYKHRIVKRKKIVTYFYVGTIKEILVYPLIGGPAISTEFASCCPYGLELDDIEDRSFVAYVDNTAIINRTYCVIDKIFRDIDMPNFLSRPFKTGETDCIKYLKEATLEVIKQEDVTNISRAIANVPTLNIGYLSQHNRDAASRKITSNDVLRCSFDVTSPYYANYTLVNSKSLEVVEEALRREIKPHHFRAQLVLDGVAPFQEDNFQTLMIRKSDKLEFTNIEPSTHSYMAAANDNESMDYILYRYLKNNRCTTRWGIDREHPAFGINMQVNLGQSEKQTILIGDVVWATYMP